MTRARHSLAVFDRADIRPSLPETLTGSAILKRQFEAQPTTIPTTLVTYATLGLDDIQLSYPGYFAADHPIHAALSALTTGERLEMHPKPPEKLGLFDARATCVAVLSRKGAAFWREHLDAIVDLRILALVHRSTAQESESDRRDLRRVAEWEIPIAEVVFKVSKVPPS
jgi:ATP-dependent DNA helicase RecQ